MTSIVGSRIGSIVDSLVGASTSDAQFTPANTSAQFAAMTGVTPSAIYLCNEASGSLVDVLGGTSLAAVAAPVYQQQVDDRLGVAYPKFASHGADVNALGVASGWYGAVFMLSDSTIALPGIVGRNNAAFTESVNLYMQTAGAGWSIQVRDDAAGQASITGTLNVSRGAWFGQIQIDRAASLARGMVSRIGGGPTESISVSIAGFGSLDGAAQVFGAGALGFIFGGGATVGYIAAATGVQCEGAAFMSDMARNLGVG